MSLYRMSVHVGGKLYCLFLCNKWFRMHVVAFIMVIRQQLYELSVTGCTIMRLRHLTVLKYPAYLSIDTAETGEFQLIKMPS